MSEWKRNKRRTAGIPKVLIGKNVEARQRDGTIFIGVVGQHEWLQDIHFDTSDNCDADLMAYRIIEQNEPVTSDYTNGYPKGTTAADIGAKVGDEFLMIDDAHHGADLGEKVILAEDDGTSSPFFTNSRGLKHCISWIFLSPVFPKSAIELQAEEVGIPEPVKEWPEDRIDVVGQNGNDGLHYDDIHLGIKRPDGEGFVKYNAGDVIDLDGVVSIDWIGGGWPDELITSHAPEYLDFAPHEPHKVAWYRLNYAEQIDTSPERVEIEQESVRIPTEATIEQKCRDLGVDIDALRGFTEDVNLGPFNTAAVKTAPEFLQFALQTLTQRGKDYDKPEGERSASAVAVAFNAITGRNITEAEVWLVLQLVKDVRQWQNPGRYHADSALDCVAYAALKAEALAKGG